ncbi:cryptochrome DASH [Bacteroidetes bacterium UKL13-3]|nr:cryptochrome DASH [Bacteroidetes bacterium UKL13-3]HCP93802.1 cryptochrome DASH [Bacteroidota bacterium]
MKRSIVWFKTDLRLHDNETLVQAIAQSDEVIPVFCIDESHFRTTEFGFVKMGKFRTQFLLESLNDLDKNLRAIGSGLCLVSGKPEVEISKLVIKHGVQKVFAKKEVAYEELQTQAAVETALEQHNCVLETFSTSTLYHAQDLPFPLKDIPDVFTRFRKNIEVESTIRDVFVEPSVINSPEIEPLQLPTISGLGLEEVVPDSRASIIFNGGESEGKKRLDTYLFETQSISSYKETRNSLVGENYSSKFSAWLALGCLSARQIYHEIKRYEEEVGANESTYWLVFELLWRDYFRFMMKKHKHSFFMQQGIKAAGKTIIEHNPILFNNWINGKTGNDFIDANMLELKLTGFMSNRGRQNVASYLCHQLKLDWRWGAAYFEQQLIDYDVCSNWGNWAYLAGVGNDPRGSRVFNTEKQADEYDKNKLYRAMWLNKCE